MNATNPEQTFSAPLAEISAEQKQQAFKARFVDSDCDANDKESGVFRSPDKRYLYPDQIKRLFVEVAKESDLSVPQAWHLVSYYLREEFQDLNTIRQQARNEKDKEKGKEIDTQRRELQESILQKMRDIVSDPKKYRIDPDIPFRKYENLDTDSGELINRLIDDTIEDPFHDNGQSPSPAQIYDMCADIFEKRFPGKSDDERLGKELLKNYGIRAVRNRLELYTRERKKGHLTSRHYHELEHDFLGELKDFMRDIIVRDEAASDNLRYIVTGERPNEDVAPMASVEFRIPYGVSQIKDPTEKAKKEKEAIQKIVAKYTSEEKKRFVDDFDQGLRYAFYDQAGPIDDERHLYEVMEMILKEKGEYNPDDAESEEAFTVVFKPMIINVIKEVSRIKQDINAEYKKRTLGEWQQNISRLQNELGQARQKFMTTTKNFIDIPALREFVIDNGDIDPYDILSHVEIQEEADEGIQFDCRDLNDIDALIEAFDVFVQLQESELEELRRNAGGNSIYGEDDFTTYEQEYNITKAALKDLTHREGGLSQKELTAAVERIQDAYKNLVNYIVNYSDQSKLEE